MFNSSAVVTIVSAVLSAHAGFVCPRTITITDDIALEIMFEVMLDHKIDVIRIIRSVKGANLRSALYSAKAVYAYMGKPWFTEGSY